jgi:iron complex transport system permease protein
MAGPRVEATIQDVMSERFWLGAPTVVGWFFARAIVAAILGAGLGAAGAVLQRHLNNDLADPFLLGVTGGALLGSVGIAIVVPAAWLVGFGPDEILWLSIAGAACGGGLVLAVLLFGRRRLYRNASGLILLGVVLNGFCAALTMLLMSFDHPLYPRIDYSWLVGRIEVYSPANTTLLLGLVSAGMALLVVVLGFVERSPYGDGLVPVGSAERNPAIAEALLLLGVGVISCTVAAFAGAVGFVGLMVPHVARWFSKSFRVEFWLSSLFGAVLLALADAVSQLIVWPRVLPVGVLTSLIGAVGLGWILRRRLVHWSDIGGAKS